MTSSVQRLAHACLRATRRLRPSPSAVFFAPIAAQGAVTLVAIPTLIHSAGAEAWTTVALGQAVGTVALVAITYGWPLYGPALLMRRSESPRRLLALSNATRALVFAPTAAVGVMVSLFIDSSDRWLISVSFISMAVSGLNATWLFIGTNAPWDLLKFDAAPRLAFMVAGVILVATEAPPISYPLMYTVGALSGSALSWYVVVRRHPQKPRPVTASEVRGHLVAHRIGAVTGVLMVTASSTPLLALGAAQSPTTSSFAIADRILKQAAAAAAPAGNIVIAESSLQGRTGEQVARRNLRRVLRQSLVILLLASVLGAPMLRLLSAGRFIPSAVEVGLLATLIALSVLVQALPATVLAPVGRLGTINQGLALGIVVAVPAVLGGAALGGLSGALAAAVLVQCVVLSTMGLRRATRPRRRSHTQASPFSTT